jgi:hypothetical protein
MSLSTLRKTSIPAASSPKRKRSGSVDPATAAASVEFAPRLNSPKTTATCKSSHGLQTPDSPRTSVATKFSNLQIEELSTPFPVLEFGVAEKTKKKAKVEVLGDHSIHTTTPLTESSDNKYSLKNNGRAQEPKNSRTPNFLIETDHTTDDVDKTQRLQDNTIVSEDPMSASKIPHIVTEKPQARKRGSRLPKINDLFWHESEITGYTMTDSDDDGTGLNGIGFRPTPTIANLRERQRRDRIKEWKALEARKEREKRNLRRRGILDTKDTTKEKHAASRTVRFADEQVVI